MNKKVITLIVTLIIIAIVGVAIYLITGNNENKESLNNRKNTSETKNITTSGSNTLILYFSMSGNTEAVANIIHDEVGGDIIRLETAQTYPEDYDDLVDYAQEEQQDNARPELSTTIENMEEYDTIFLGYPNWWGDMPMPIYTFLDNYDLSGKTIAPFITHGGSGLSGTPENIQEEEPDATVTEGLSIYGDEAENSQSDVRDWLNGIGY